MDEKAQGSLEYLLLIGGAVLVGVVVIVLILSITGAAKRPVLDGLQKYKGIVDGP